MRRVCLFLFAVCAFVTGCDTRALEEPTSFDDEFLMPLDSTNQWTYQMTRTDPAPNGETTTTSGRVAFEITGMARLGQIDFAVLDVRSDDLDVPFQFGGYLRNSNEGLVKLPPTADERFVFRYPFGFDASYTVPTIGSLSGSSEVILSDQEITVPAGTFDCYVYTIVTPGRPTQRDAYAAGLGLVHREIEGQIVMELLSYDLQP